MYFHSRRPYRSFRRASRGYAYRADVPNLAPELVVVRDHLRDAVDAFYEMLNNHQELDSLANHDFVDDVNEMLEIVALCDNDLTEAIAEFTKKWGLR